MDSTCSESLGFTSAGHDGSLMLESGTCVYTHLCGGVGREHDYICVPLQRWRCYPWSPKTHVGRQPCSFLSPCSWGNHFSVLENLRDSLEDKSVGTKVGLTVGLVTSPSLGSFEGARGLGGPSELQQLHLCGKGNGRLRPS